jgi:dimethylamine/trimethylamine dehydrogenase
MEVGEQALRETGVHGVYRIGDCLAPRLIADCIFYGHRLAREIDTEDPARPLPYVRERRVLGGLNDEEYDATRRQNRDGYNPSSVLTEKALPG